MDANQFDSFARRLGKPSSRRTALGASLASGLLGALGLGSDVSGARAAQRETCSLAFSANVRLGPGANLRLTAEGQPGSLRGELRFALDQSGRLTDGEFEATSGERYPVVGQATGHSLQARIELAPRVAVVVVGVGEQEVAACEGAIDGVMSGPEVGDLGDWHAVATEGGRRRDADGQDAAGNTSREGRAERSGGRAREGRAAGGNAGGSSGGNTGGNTGGRQGGGGRDRASGAQGSSGGGQASGGQSGGGGGQASAAQSAADCRQGEVFCNLEGGYCADLATNPLNCGACGNVCSGETDFCASGVCVAGTEDTECAAGLILCDGECDDPMTSPVNCGGCGTRCPSIYCVDGRCLTEEEADSRFQTDGCADGESICDGACVDLLSDADNCGSCGNVCQTFPEIFNCENGVCVEPSCDPLTKCGFLCVDILTDSLHCGACDVACEEGTTCQNGDCTGAGGGGCRTGLMMCNGTCIDPGFDNANCGGCGITCAAGENCVIGACVPIGSGGGCKTGLTGCGGVCVDLNSDPANCGGCGFACLAGETCQFGVCTAPALEQAPLNCADQGLVDCFGFCVDLQTDPFNCGFCGESCASGQCGGGFCVEAVDPTALLCPDGQADCGGGCIDIFSDPFNCGFCGNACTLNTTCVFGVCSGQFEIPAL